MAYSACRACLACRTSIFPPMSVFTSANAVPSFSAATPHRHEHHVGFLECPPPLDGHVLSDHGRPLPTTGSTCLQISRKGCVCRKPSVPLMSRNGCSRASLVNTEAMGEMAVRAHKNTREVCSLGRANLFASRVAGGLQNNRIGWLNEVACNNYLEIYMPPPPGEIGLKP